MTATIELRGAKVVVVGLAATGLAVARFLYERGASVTVSEARPAGSLETDPGLLPPGTALELGGHKSETFAAADLVVPSPGVPRDLPFMAAALKRGVPVWSEIEIACRFIGKPILAVTGTNGKSTTVSLLGAILEAGGLRAPVVGNIGTPLISLAGHDEAYDCLVVEISSFQLEWIVAFRPRLSAVLNITDDHLDRYRDFDDYADTKMLIASRQNRADALIVNADDPAVVSRLGRVSTRVIKFSHRPVTGGVWRHKDVFMTDLGGGPARELMPAAELKLTGAHNWENFMAAAAMALDYGVPPEAVRRAAAEFKGLPHRNELVAEIDGVRWYDDSKGTNVGAVVKSLQGFDGPVILIAGGREKGGSYLPLAPPVKEKVKALILIGEARARMKAELGALTDVVEAATMNEAVESAAARAVAGDIVLLSPACSSFDMFTGYHHRGEVFKQAVSRLPCRAR